MKKPIAAVLTITVALTGCASVYKIQPQPTGQQDKFLSDGQEVLMSQMKHIVAIAPKEPVVRDSRQQFGLNILVKHTGTLAITVGPQQIKARFNEQSLAIYTADEVLAEIEKNQRIATASAAFGGAMSAAGASRSGGRVRESGYVSGYSSSGQYVSGNYTASGYSSAAAQNAVNAANAQTESNLASIRASGSAQSARYSGNSFNAHTLSPGEWYGGSVYFDAISPGKDLTKLKVDVEVDGDVHQFTMDVSQVAK